MIIAGPSQPTDFNVLLRIVVNEFAELWHGGEGIFAVCFLADSIGSLHQGLNYRIFNGTVVRSCAVLVNQPDV